MRVTCFGRVQGVFFRQTTLEVANRLSLTGWVKNTREGTVEAIFEGSSTDVDKIVNWCRKGPEYANVERISVVDETQILQEYKSFIVEKTI